MLIIIIIGLVLLTTVLIVAGLWLMQEESASRQPASRPAGSSLELPSASSRPTQPPDLQWKRPYRVPWALTSWNAGLFMAYGLGLILTLPAVLYWVGGFSAIDRSNLSPFGCIFMLPFVVIPLLIVSTQVWMLVKGVQDWQKVKALEAQGQLTQGVLLDRWSGLGRGSQYCVAYYFELPWGNLGGGPLIRAEVNKEAHRAYQVGDSVKVRYLPDNPKVCRLEV
ncbi:MAG TPA: DUF3592 domain-containing protein [Anaerolineae bacterium]|nr:DUF3592 domain-containing protein [Anaerolineae bacterium]